MVDGPTLRREEPKGPLPLDNVAEKAAGTTEGKVAMGGMPNGHRQGARKRGDQLEGLLREVDRQAVVDRAEPRWNRLEELDAEAHWPRKGSRKALKKRMKLLTHPTKGDLRLVNARERPLTRPRGSPPEAIRLMAVPEGRQRRRKKDRREKAKDPLLTDLDRSRVTQEVFGKRWLIR